MRERMRKDTELRHGERVDDVSNHGALLADPRQRPVSLARAGPSSPSHIHLGHEYLAGVVLHCHGRLQFASLVAGSFLPESSTPGQARAAAIASGFPLIER